MISMKILDNDMGAVARVPLTGRGTVHGITIEVEGTALPQIDLGLMDMLAPDMAIPRVQALAEQHVTDPDMIKKLVQSYTAFVTPLNRSRR